MMEYKVPYGQNPEYDAPTGQSGWIDDGSLLPQDYGSLVRGEASVDGDARSGPPFYIRAFLATGICHNKTYRGRAATECAREGDSLAG
uniref:Uncharacterized protein n=1 Tax=Candidatus Kentrum sp. UNK TaxID=2126344 RepID=A0A451B074_9GAMM|nr:MAG: hypothetical protein BECKUNK1418G_GA0071005_10959 [Candidatus Kentron sp. UNK]VFK71687.1 MAG: hypothetical protein BECKUNK1418H_GA0071006_107812 [Candidatus Kentron sp. UNK]